MKAPSEKHLEDWIIANPDRVIDQRTGFVLTRNLIMEANQVHLHKGIADIIDFKKRQISVIELKRDRINNSAVVQLMRYLASVMALWEDIAIQLMIEMSPSLPPVRADNPPVFTGTLIGHRLDNPKIPMIYPAVNVEIYLYDYDRERDEYTFELQKPPKLNRESLTNDAVYHRLHAWMMGGMQ